MTLKMDITSVASHVGSILDICFSGCHCLSLVVVVVVVVMGLYVHK